MNQRLAVRLLEKMGYRADVVGNGLEALAALERQRYDLLLSDVQMPEMDGLEATREIVLRWPPDQRPWIVEFDVLAPWPQIHRGRKDLLAASHDAGVAVLDDLVLGPSSARASASASCACCRALHFARSPLLHTALGRTDETDPNAHANV